MRRGLAGASVPGQRSTGTGCWRGAYVSAYENGIRSSQWSAWMCEMTTASILV
jgi:hypothetical protein